MIVENDFLLIRERWNSQLLRFYGNDTIFLNKPPTTKLIQDGCRFLLNDAPFTGEQIGDVENFNFGSIRISDQKGVSCIPFFYRVDSYLLYKNTLTLSHIVNEMGEVSGFVAI